MAKAEAKDAKGAKKSGGGWIRTLERTGITKGLFGASKPWFYVGTGLWTLRTIRRLAERKPEILLSEALRPGERMTIANGVATIEQVVQTQLQAKARRGRRSR
jgi:hypothetical protein